MPVSTRYCLATFSGNDFLRMVLLRERIVVVKSAGSIFISLVNGPSPFPLSPWQSWQ